MKNKFSFKIFFLGVIVPKRLTTGLRNIFRWESQYNFYVHLNSVPNERVFYVRYPEFSGAGRMSEIISFGILWWE
jgi:hypothetical protein